jgi:transcription antitermination factor NusG
MNSELKEIGEIKLALKEKTQSKFETNWYVFYTFPKAERVVHQELAKRDYEVFLPKTKSLRIWKNRQKKWIDQILFPGYIFVNTQQSEIYTIARVSKIVTYLHCGGKPSIIPAKEIEGIKGMLNLNQDISVEIDFCEGERVKIIQGPLTGYEGILVKKNGKTKFGIQLKEINHTIFIDMHNSVLKKV